MKRLALAAGIILMGFGSVKAQMIVLEGVDSSTTTTGDLLDGVDHAGITTNVVEIPGLQITARSGAADQDINVTVSSLGITIFNSGDDTDAFDAGEKLIISFNKEIRINRFDFNQFTVDESITVSINGEIDEIHDLELTHRGSDYLDTNLVVSANTEIEFYTTGSSIVGLDGIDVTVLGGSDPALSLVFSNGSASVSAVFDGASATNHVLQSCGDLASNVWSTVSAPFSVDTNWVIQATNSAEFFRIIAQ